MAWTRLGGSLWVPGGVQIGKGSELRSAIAVATNAQMLALLGTDKTIVPAPGAGFAVLVDSVFFFFDSAGAYTLGTADLRVSYAGDTDIIGTITESGFLDQATDQMRAYRADSPHTPVANAAVVLRSVTADLTGGNAANTVTVVTQYRVVKAGPGTASF